MIPLPIGLCSRYTQVSFGRLRSGSNATKESNPLPETENKNSNMSILYVYVQYIIILDVSYVCIEYHWSTAPPSASAARFLPSYSADWRTSPRWSDLRTKNRFNLHNTNGMYALYLCMYVCMYVCMYRISTFSAVCFIWCEGGKSFAVRPQSLDLVEGKIQLS